MNIPSALQRVTVVSKYTFCESFIFLTASPVLTLPKESKKLRAALPCLPSRTILQTFNITSKSPTAFNSPCLRASVGSESVATIVRTRNCGTLRKNIFTLLLGYDYKNRDTIISTSASIITLFLIFV